MTQSIKVAYCLDRLVNSLNYFTVPFPEGANKRKLFDLILRIRTYIQLARVECTKGGEGYVIMDIVTKARHIKGWMTDIKKLLLEDEFKTYRSGIQSIMSTMVNAADGMCFEDVDSEIITLVSNDATTRTQWVEDSDVSLLIIEAKLNEFEQHFS